MGETSVSSTRKQEKIKWKVICQKGAVSCAEEASPAPTFTESF